MIVQVEGSTPLCLLCPCNSEPNTPPNINCERANINNIYDKSFWLDDSNVSYPISSVIFKYNNLKELKTRFPSSDLILLDLSNNSISEIGYGVFGELQKMEVLILGNNDIAWLDPDAFRGVYNKDEYFPLKSLRTLDLNNNKLHSLNADVFEHIDELEVLILNNNPLKVIDTHTLTAVASLIQLRILDLSYTQIKDLPEYFLHTPKYLTVLDLSTNNFDTIPKALEETHALETLYFNNNPIQNLSGTNIFPKISTLKTLHMSRMPLLEEVHEHALSELQNLNELHLSYNKRLRYIHSDAFMKRDKNDELFSPITKLFMEYNNISYLSKHTLNHLGSLKALDLRGNPWSCDCLNQWLVSELIPEYMKIDEPQSKELECANPIEMKGLTLYELYQKKSVMRCLDIYGNRPEQDALLLIGTLSGVLTGVVLLMFLVYIYRIKRLNNGIYTGGPISTHPHYSRV